MAKRQRAVAVKAEEEMPDIEMTEAVRDMWIAEFQRMLNLMESVGRLTKMGLAAGQEIEGYEKARILAVEKLQRRYQSFFGNVT